MRPLEELFDNNKKWAEARLAEDPRFFEDLAKGQSPTYLWIGCADSRVPASQVMGLPPGQVFVHRNIANVVSNTDLNCLSVIQFAVEMLEVRHIIVCGHYGCGGVGGALGGKSLGLIDNWLREIRDVQNAAEPAEWEGDKSEADRLCELNVAAQVRNVCRTGTVQDAWQRGQALSVHGLIYSLGDGLLNELGIHVDGPDTLAPVYRLR